MRAGPLREMLQFERAQPDDQGRPTGQFASIFPPQHARAVSLRGSESVLAQRLEGVQTYEFEVRYSSTMTATLTTADRLRWLRTGQVFNITAITPDEKLTRITILAIMRAGGTPG